jgi:hypothetical protein
MNLMRTISRCFFAGVSVATSVALALAAAGQANAAEISWKPSFIIDDPSDIKNPPGSSVHAALDFNTAEGAATSPDGDDIINGIPFIAVNNGSPGSVTTSFSDGPSFNATYHPGGTGDGDLDDLLDAHSYLGGGTGTATITLEGLSVGQPYLIQAIGVADLRGCCADRTYEPDDGLGNFTTGVTVQRGLFQSTLGTFTADAETQAFQWRSLGGMGNNDPGFSGLVVLAIPEPSSWLLAAVGGLACLAIRRFGARSPR